jgi:uncharacterized protein YciI
MLYVILFEDNESRAEMRTLHMADHLSFLEANAAAIRGAGPLSDAETGTAAGGLWLVEADTPEAVQALYQADPFWPTGLRKSVRVLRWRQVFGDGHRLIR